MKKIVIRIMLNPTVKALIRFLPVSIFVARFNIWTLKNDITPRKRLADRANIVDFQVCPKSKKSNYFFYNFFSVLGVWANFEITLRFARWGARERRKCANSNSK